ncbi:hypothetical protein [Anaerorhabdus sp.]|uniref:hypothetical protein n=1 Tax=Anaerorhabdus sp. TaxID=1872524 RepID=UPI002B1EC12D|nr:hypothetical protein [Anaerorhabdus sp.]MEA4876033.1 hypothetical protein [Anaerorhabdus sp.]
MFINRIKKTGGRVQKDYILKDGVFKNGYSLSKVSGNATSSILNNKIRINAAYASGVSYFKLNGDFTNKIVYILLYLNTFEDYSKIFMADNTANSSGVPTALAQSLIDNGGKGTKNFGTTNFFLVGQSNTPHIGTWSTQNTDIVAIWTEV